ncbi:hypothetical protein KM043_017928 [Ampulex compressa]|nr:hypothetical protein KM043_017928 [Ampulex compressa]
MLISLGTIPESPSGAQGRLSSAQSDEERTAGQKSLLRPSGFDPCAPVIGPREASGTYSIRAERRPFSASRPRYGPPRSRQCPTVGAAPLNSANTNAPVKFLAPRLATFHWAQPSLRGLLRRPTAGIACAPAHASGKKAVLNGAGDRTRGSGAGRAGRRGREIEEEVEEEEEESEVKKEEEGAPETGGELARRRP